MKHTAKSSGYFAALRTRGISALFAIIGVAALAVFGVMGVAAASGYNVAQPVGKMLGIRMGSTTTPLAAHAGALSGARVSELPDGRIVVSMDVSGDFKGLVSVWIDRGSGTTISGGDWSLVHAYTEDVEVEGRGENPEPEHAEGEAFFNKGTLGGHITGGSITLNPDGSVASLSGLQLSLTSGSLTYQGVTGDGTAQVSNVSDLENSAGTITLNF